MEFYLVLKSTAWVDGGIWFEKHPHQEGAKDYVQVKDYVAKLEFPQYHGMYHHHLPRYRE